MSRAASSFRLVRITTTSVCVAFCVAVTVLWLRSYWWMDQLIHRISKTDYVGYTTIQGQFALGWSNDPILRKVFKEKWTRRGFALSYWDKALGSPMACFPVSAPGPRDTELVRVPRFRNHMVMMEVIIPYWLLVLPTAALATVPWEKWRVGLGGLLTVATFVTAMLALLTAVIQ